MILSLDVSSSAVGGAVLGGPRLSDVRHSFLFRPKGKTVAARLAQVRLGLIAALAESPPLLYIDHCIIEQPTHVHGRMGAKMSGAGMATLGMAVGVAFGYMAQYRNVELVPANTWTRGQPKAKRARALMGWSGWSLELDPGYDRADAILMGIWWHERQLVEAATGQPVAMVRRHEDATRIVSAVAKLDAAKLAIMALRNAHIVDGVAHIPEMERDKAIAAYLAGAPARNPV